MNIMNMRRQIDTMKPWLDELAEAYEIADPDKATKTILSVIVKIQWRLAQHAKWAVAGEGLPEEDDESKSAYQQENEAEPRVAKTPIIEPQIDKAASFSPAEQALIEGVSSEISAILDAVLKKFPTGPVAELIRDIRDPKREDNTQLFMATFALLVAMLEPEEAVAHLERMSSYFPRQRIRRSLPKLPDRQSR